MSRCIGVPLFAVDELKVKMPPSALSIPSFFLFFFIYNFIASPLLVYLYESRLFSHPIAMNPGIKLNKILST